MVEFAMVVGLFIFILYGLVSFGMVLATKQRVTSAASDAARAAVGETSDANAIAAATTRVAASLTAGSYNLTPAPSVAVCGGTHRCITVTIVYNLQPSPGLGLVVPPTTTAKAVVQYS
jgi:Flp pilus assembly protein TadG